MDKFRCIYKPLSRRLICNCFAANRLSTSVVVSELNKDDRPYPFISQYKQDRYKVVDTFRAPENYTWKYQPYIMIGCIAIFLVYFTILREEHDTDEWLAKTLYDTVPGLEEQDLRKKIKMYKTLGKSTDILEKRLEILLADKN